MTELVNQLSGTSAFGTAGGASMQTEASKPAARREAQVATAMKLCLAGSGGGHVRQLLDLEPVWSQYDHFFVSEDTALTRSIAQKSRTHFVPHFALGQARLGSPLRMAWGAIKNFVESGRIMMRERPDVLISTGAGAVFFPTLWARLLGARVVIVESFARFQHPSVFARLTAPFAHHKVVQSAALAHHWPDAAVFDPLRMLETPRPQKKPLLFATVGAILPFDRLVNMVGDLKASGAISEDVVIQTGANGARPSGAVTHETLSFDDMQAFLKDADIVVCHGGTGSIITALRQGCRVIAVPRLFSHGEVYDDHQAEITKAFAERGLLTVANTKEELAAALAEVRVKSPISATSEPKELIAYLDKLLSERAQA